MCVHVPLFYFQKCELGSILNDSQQFYFIINHNFVSRIKKKLIISQHEYQEWYKKKKMNTHTVVYTSDTMARILDIIFNQLITVDYNKREISIMLLFIGPPANYIKAPFISANININLAFMAVINYASYPVLTSHTYMYLTHWERRPHLYLLLRGNKSLLYYQIGNRNFFIFITVQWNLMFCVDKIKYEHLAILSNLKSCQFAPKIVIFNLFICCQFEDSQIILSKIIPMSRRNI